MEHGDVARLLGVAGADLKHYVESDEGVSVVLTNGVERMWTSDGVFAVNDCPQNRSLRPLPDALKDALVTEDEFVMEEGERLGGPHKPLSEAIEGDTTEHVSEPDYEAWTPKQLREVLADRGLPTNGQKPTLIARLQEADAQ